MINASLADRPASLVRVLMLVLPQRQEQYISTQGNQFLSKAGHPANSHHAHNRLIEHFLSQHEEPLLQTQRQRRPRQRVTSTSCPKGPIECVSDWGIGA